MEVPPVEEMELLAWFCIMARDRNLSCKGSIGNKLRVLD